METLGERIARLRRAKKYTQHTFADACGWDSASRVGNYERDLREPSLADLRLMARILGVPLIELIEGDTPNEVRELPEQYAAIPQLTAIAAAGNGHLNDHVEVNGGLVFKREWLYRKGLKPQNLIAFYAEGHSMEPTIADGDVLLLDKSQTDPVTRGIYAIRRPNGEISVKRLIQSLTGRWIIRSDNDDKRQFPDEPVSQDEMEGLAILGRIVWHAGVL